jgi:hypothetical protein
MRSFRMIIGTGVVAVATAAGVGAASAATVGGAGSPNTNAAGSAAVVAPHVRHSAGTIAPPAVVAPAPAHGSVPGARIAARVARSAAGETCDGPYTFNWHWKDNPLFFDVDIANTTLTVGRCWDGHGNIAGDSSVGQTSVNAWWGNLEGAVVQNGSFQLVNSYGGTNEYSAIDSLNYCSQGECTVATQVRVYVWLESDGWMEIGTDPAVYIQESNDPGFVPNNDSNPGADDLGQYVAPPPQSGASITGRHVSAN